MIFTIRIKIALIILLTIIIIGTVGFHIIEGWSFVDSFYLCMATLSTVGYGDFVPASTAGKLFAVFVIIFGVGMMFYTLVLIAETFIEGRLRYVLGGGKLERIIEKMHNHYIICGGGRIGFLICRELMAGKVPCLIIDNHPDVIQKAQDEGFIYCKGDATQDKVLLAAGIKRAKGIICVLPSDAENLYVILTAKELNQKIYIMARSEEEESEHRLLRAGADKVMSPYTLGGVRMAMAIMRPAMLDFIEITTSRQSLELRMEEISIGKNSHLVAKTLEDSGIRKQFGLIIVAVKKESGKMMFNPLASYIIEAGDRLIAMGEDENVKQFAQSCTE
ncbi:MAG TPA: potassium channel protein [Smithella sp.]|nr:potassium channel protein [Smithella sp.]MDM7988705.1 potassium channel protein [Smithella sp.]HNY49350.1 potassium channel protein [Smithella sp.]HOG89459.1 potassium channel protein [Smithella sp.]HOU50178.1 potassium channel protein [Smithella sp.]